MTHPADTTDTNAETTAGSGPPSMALSPAAGVWFAFSGRAGGVSREPFDGLNLARHVGDDDTAVTRNRELAAASLGLAPDLLVWMHQVHGNSVAVVDGPRTSEPPEVDALVTATPGLALAVLVADCTPLLLADPAARVVGAVHVGRAGLARGVVPAAVAAMIALGARPERMTAATGPAICGACYEVPAAMRADVASVVPAAWAVTRTGTPALDVTAGVWAQLAAAGVPAGSRSPVCTRESAECFSYRASARTGRFAGFVWLEPPAV